MKYVLLTLSLLTFNSYANIAPVPTNTVCIKVYDAILKKETQRCRKIKQHKKYEGKAIV